MGKITPVNNGDTGLDARTKLNEAMQTVESNGTLTGEGTTANPLAVVNSGVPESKTRTGTNLVFDEMSGAFYNAAAPSNAAAITLDGAGAKVGSVCAFYNDGNVEPTVTPTPNPAAGDWGSGNINVFWFTSHPI